MRILSSIRNRFMNMFLFMAVGGGTFYALHFFPANCAWVAQYLLKALHLGELAGYDAAILREIAADLGYHYGPYIGAGFLSFFAGGIGYKAPDMVSYVSKKVTVRVPHPDGKSGEIEYECGLEGGPDDPKVTQCVRKDTGATVVLAPHHIDAIGSHFSAEPAKRSSVSPRKGTNRAVAPAPILHAAGTRRGTGVAAARAHASHPSSPRSGSQRGPSTGTDTPEEKKSSCTII